MHLPVVPSVLAVIFSAGVFAAYALEPLHFCEQRYPANDVMQDTCLEQQREAVRWILNYMASHQLGSEHRSKDTPHSRIFTKCLDNWGNNYAMGKYCIEQKTELYDKLQKLINAHDKWRKQRERRAHGAK
jgi:hypothetical protein